MRWIYLDYNATTPLAPAAQEAMLPYLADRYAHPHADHTPGRVVAEALDDARSRVAGAIGAHADELRWTSGGTEASRNALRGVIEPALRRGETPHLIVSAVEPPAVLGTARFLASLGAELTVVPVSAEGIVSVDAVLAALRADTRLVSVCVANDEVGSCQPVAEIAAACHDEGVLIHTDASLALGKLPLDVGSLGVDMLTLSAHKAYGPKGVGALYVRAGAPIEPELLDAAEPSLGMPNVPGVVGFGAAAAIASAAVDEAATQMRVLRGDLAERLQSGCPDVTIYSGPADARLCNTLCVALPNVTASDLLAAAPEITAQAMATGDPAAISLSPTLDAIGADPAEAAGAVRLSLGWYTDAEEVARAADALLAAWDQCQG
ncbi:MAG: cysteine desulfurase family protein [Planctomycetota bacterium]